MSKSKSNSSETITVAINGVERKNNERKLKKEARTSNSNSSILEYTFSLVVKSKEKNESIN